MTAKIGSFFQNPELGYPTTLCTTGPVGILLVHGFTATNLEVSHLATILNQHEITTLCPLLPGHGTTLEDLNRCKWQNWAQHIEKNFDILTHSCSTVFVGGESLGSLLSLYLALKYRDIAGLLIFSPPLIVRNMMVRLAPFAKFFLKNVKKNEAGQSADSIVDRRWQGYRYDSLPALAETLYLKNYVCKNLSFITQPICIFQGLLDTNVDPMGAKYLFNSVASTSKEIIWLEKSSHCILLDDELEISAEKSLQFIKSHIND